MGVMQVARPLKPQDSRCVTYLADANSRKKSLDAFDIDGVSQGKCAKNVFVSKKAYRDLTRSVAFSEDLTSCVKLRRKYEFEKQGIRVDLNLQVVESNSCSTGQDSEQTLSSLGENADECIVSSLTKRVDQLLKSYRDGKTTVRNGWYIKPDVSGLDLDDLKRIEIISNDIEGEIVRCYKERQDHPSWNETEMKRVTRRKVPDLKVQTCGRGRPRKKSLGKRGSNSCDKQSSQDGSENGEGRTSRGRQQRNGGQGNGGSGGGRRRRDDDDREDDNDDIEDDFDENNEDDDEEDDEQTGTESVADETELTPEQEAEMAQVR